MKELSFDEKIRLLEEVLKDPTNNGLCVRISNKAFFLGYITRKKWYESDIKIVSTLIPEFLRIKPYYRSMGNYWFGDPTKENIPVRQEKLKKLIEFLKSKQP